MPRPNGSGEPRNGVSVMDRERLTRLAREALATPVGEAFVAALQEGVQDQETYSDEARQRMRDALVAFHTARGDTHGRS